MNNRLQTIRPTHCAYCDYVIDESGDKNVPECDITGKEVTWYGAIPAWCPLEVEEEKANE